MQQTLDNFFRWLVNIHYFKDLIIRAIVVGPLGIIAIMIWFISVPIFGWYIYTKYGNTRIAGCRCPKCNKLNDCNDKFCIYCGHDMRIPYQQYQQSRTQQSTQKKTCQKCSYDNDKDSRFCVQCGNNTFIDNTIYHEDHTIAGYVITLLAYIAKGDDVISSNEAVLISKILDQMSLGDKVIRDVLKNIFNRTKDAPSRDHKNISDKLFQTITQEISIPSERYEFLSMIALQFMALVYIDGGLNAKQNIIVTDILKNLHFTDAQIKEIHHEFQETKHSNPNVPTDKEYAVLNCIESDSDDKIKRSYRELAKQYHPDTLHGKELPEAIMLMATEKFKEINSAYEKIKKYRGIK